MQPAARIAPQPWMTAPPTQAALAALSAEGAVVRFVGGCVRDALLGRPIRDVDIATPDPPETVVRLLEGAAIKVVPTGLAHGTVTAIVPPRHFEITTLRRDVETDGRHAKVAFTDDWAVDASRRDFTINALFLDAGGTVFDPVGGMADLRTGRVRFVGDAERRIREDVLRLLRFYRFHAHYGRGPANAEARAACRTLAPLLPDLSAERVAAELLKLLAAVDPLPALGYMVEDGVLTVLLPENVGLERLAKLLTLETAGDPLRRLAALLPSDERAVIDVADRLRMSSKERDRLALLAAPTLPMTLQDDPRRQRRALRRLGLEAYRDLVLLEAARQAVEGSGEGAAAAARVLIEAAPARLPPSFPLRGRDVTRLGIPAGKRVGALLASVETWWEEGDYRADREACLAQLAALAAGAAGESRG